MATRRCLSAGDVADYFMNCDDSSEIESNDSDEEDEPRRVNDDLEGKIWAICSVLEL